MGLKGKKQTNEQTQTTAAGQAGHSNLDKNDVGSRNRPHEGGGEKPLGGETVTGDGGGIPVRA